MVKPPHAADANYSFSLQDHSAVGSDSPSHLENSANSKQKRRRTSPRDHAILEAAYQRNSKPDKHERANVVSQVDLGEKEVQIWFQNRRQNDRRKAKPLQPHELLAHFRNGAPAQTTQQLAATDAPRSHPQVIDDQLVPQSTCPESRSPSIHELLNPPSSAETVASRGDGLIPSQSTAISSTPPSSLEDNNRPLDASNNGLPSKPSAHATAESSHSRKRSHEVMLDKPTTNGDALSTDNVSTLPQANPLTRSSSFVRLAMTVDGAVKVRTNDEATPSPPKQRTLPPFVSSKKRESLGRSQSAIENGLMFKDINPPIRKVAGAGFGRSRDARTWEFYCDRDSGDALSTQAEAERSGSAVGAINLIRSRSQRNKNQTLSPNPAKQNSHRVSTRQSEGKAALSRARSSMARLQNFDGNDENGESNAKRAKHDRSPSGDSDKENWAPGTRTSRHHMRRMHPSAPRDSILQENDFPSARPIRNEGPIQGQEKRSVGGKEKAKGDDLDCIQGLLSLSQGAWR